MKYLTGLVILLSFLNHAYAQETNLNSINNELEKSFMNNNKVAVKQAEELTKKYLNEALQLPPQEYHFGEMLKDQPLDLSIEIKSADNTVETKITHKGIKITKRF